MQAWRYRVVVSVPNIINEAVEFYSQVLGMPGERIEDTRHYFDCQGTILALVDLSGHPREWRPNPDIVYFAVPDIEETCSRTLDAGCQPPERESEQGIQTQPWGERSFYVGDPFGNPIYFVDDQTLFLGHNWAYRDYR